MPSNLVKHVMTTSRGRSITCYDVAGWTNGADFDCKTYQEQKLCARGVVEKHAKWAAGPPNNYPERSCCSCGRWRLKLNASAAGQAVVDASAATAATAAAGSSGAQQDRMPAKAVPCWSTSDPAVPWGTSSFCPAWPRYLQENGSQLSGRQKLLLQAAATRAIAPFAEGGLTREMLLAAIRPKCAQRLCLHVQILKRRLLVVCRVPLQHTTSSSSSSS